MELHTSGTHYSVVYAANFLPSNAFQRKWSFIIPSRSRGLEFNGCFVVLIEKGFMAIFVASKICS